MGGDHHVHDGLVPRGISHTASATRISFEGIVRASQLSQHMPPPTWKSVVLVVGKSEKN